MHVRRNPDTPLRNDLGWDDLWSAEDDGLIACWENGRRLGQRNPALAAAARAGELVELPWKGRPHPPKTNSAHSNRRWGTPYYLAMWQGLRGCALDVNTTAEVDLTCSVTGLLVTFTADRRRWAGSP